MTQASDDHPSLHALADELPEELRPPDPASPAGRILREGRRLFAARGYGSTTTRAIAAAAGVNQAMIHYYFGTKARLYRRVVQTELLDLFRIIADGVDEQAPPEQVVPRLPLFGLRLHRDHPELTRLMLREMADGAPHLPAILAELGEHGPLGLGRRFLALMERGGREGGGGKRRGGKGRGGKGSAGDFAADLPPRHLLAILFSVGNGLQAFAPLLAAAFGVDLRDPQTFDAVGASVERLFTRALARDKESSR